MKQLDVPEVIHEKIDEYRKNSREKYQVLPVMIQFDDKRNFSIRFPKRDRYLIVDEEGNVPGIEECKPVLRIAAGLESALQEWAEWKEKIPVRFRLNNKRYSRLQALLNKMNDQLDMSERTLYFFERFILAVQQILDKQAKMMEHFEEAAKLVKQLLTEQVADRDRQVALQKQILLMLKYRVEGELLHYECLGARNLFVRNVKKEIPLHRLDLWITYLWIWRIHDKMYDSPFLEAVFKKGEREIRKRLERLESEDGDAEILESLMPKLLNPRE